MNTEITIEELREWSATEIMGWNFDTINQNGRWTWIDGGCVNCVWDQDWQPDSDLRQLAMVIDRWAHYPADGDIIEGKFHALNKALIENCEGWGNDASIIATLVTNPTLALRTLHKVWEQERGEVGE